MRKKALFQNEGGRYGCGKYTRDAEKIRKMLEYLNKNINIKTVIIT